MQDFLNSLDVNLKYIKHEIIGPTIHIYCEVDTPNNRKVHSRVERVIKDVPFGHYKTQLHIIAKKFFNDDSTSSKLTVYEKFSFLNQSKRRTQRLEDMLINLYKENSAIGLERIVNDGIATISDSSIIRLAKKNNQ